MFDRAWAATLGLLFLGSFSACGARTGLLEANEVAVSGASPGGSGGAGHGGAGGAGHGGSGGGQAGGGQAGGGQAGAGGVAAGAGGSVACVEGAAQACGSDVGACQPGKQICHAGVFGPCEGALGPQKETCNGVDDNCDGVIDDGFHLGEPCQGAGTDQCFDGVTTCQGCKKMGPEKVEICNGVDDNCNGVIDADCEQGDCKPTLLVTGSAPSSPGCIDFPVQAGSTGTIEYPCGGGPVTAHLGDISFTGSVTNNFVTLDGIAVIPPNQSPDGCTWQNHHHIEGSIPSGTMSYSYSEMVLAEPPGSNCWQPCTETGTVQIKWVAGP